MQSAAVRSVSLVAALSAMATLAIATLPSLHFAYREPGLHVALETIAMVVGLLAAFLVVGRLRRDRSLDALLLATGLGVLAIANLLFGALPAAIQERPGAYATWTAVACRSVGAFLVCGSAFADRTSIRVRLPAASLAVGAALAIVGATALIFAPLASQLPSGLTVVPELSERPRLDGHPVILAIQLVVAAAFAIGAIGFTRRAVKNGDRFLAWLAAACVLHAFAWLNYFLYPSLYSQWVYTGDAFRLGFYVVLFGGAALEIADYWRALAVLAVLDERRRIAREFHDAVAQEFAYIERTTAVLGDSEADERLVPRIRAAAGRGLEESRRAIATLAAPADGRARGSFEEVLERAVRETAGREGIPLRFEVDPRVDVDERRAHALIRIATEAVTNAARHGRARDVEVKLEQLRDRVRLRVVDSGTGFDPRATRSGGFGLTSMRERAEALGGEVRLSSSPGAGTVVEAEL